MDIKQPHGGAGRGQGRKPIDRTNKANTRSISITLTTEDIAYLKTIDPDNLSAAIRSLIAAARKS